MRPFTNNGPGPFPVRGVVSTMAVSDLYSETAHHEEIPRDHVVVPVDPETYKGKGLTTCGTCHVSWDDDIVTGVTPAPSGRCPFEYQHKHPDEDEDTTGGTPLCKTCGLPGHPVETITDMIVWHHEDGALEDQHDFDPADGRPTFISGHNVEHVGVLVEHLSSVDPETIPVRIQDRDGGSLRSIHHVAVHFDPADPERSKPVLVITGY